MLCIGVVLEVVLLCVSGDVRTVLESGLMLESGLTIVREDLASVGIVSPPPIVCVVLCFVVVFCVLCFVYLVSSVLVSGVV